MKNWIINPTGKPNSGVELDLMQEHLNFWHKARCLLDRKSLVDNDSPTESVSSRWGCSLMGVARHGITVYQCLTSSIRAYD